MDRRQGFTRIELLVVIAIIVVLTSLMLPARQAAWRSEFLASLAALSGDADDPAFGLGGDPTADRSVRNRLRFRGVSVG